MCLKKSERKNMFLLQELINIKIQYRQCPKYIVYDFEKYITKGKLFEVIDVVESGFKVVAIESDMGGGNLSLKKNLQISTNKVLFTNLVDVT
ncbi:hypothetical protein PR048_004711 [Dryococelus australis]|uniref:Uncharacterized protein n=1 Tax=Dryococelus australis TaxID=614101 RepID=A0ABQ9I6Z3_9NEOP|nr:hypothetical protein PR048_004711 [Dryococelus australis]